MPREKARGTAKADAAARRPAAVQKHRKGKNGRDAGARVAKPARPPPRSDLVAAPVHAKLKYANSYWEFTENKERKKKQLEFSITNDKTPPAGFTFVPVGNPELSKACKEVSREEGAMIFIVSNTKEQNHNLFDHIHRIGFHFRSYIVDQAASTLGGLQAVTGDGKPIVENAGDEIPETQEEINKQADAALRDLFPRIPNTDREMIIQHAFQKGAIFQGKPVVGLQPELTLSRRVQLAANAHIRHNHTRYDKLLHETDYLNARRVVEPLCLDIIMKWRGDEETGRDQLDELLREVVVIPDSDEESEEEESASDDDEVQFLREVVHAAPHRQGANPRHGNRFHVDDPRRNMEQSGEGNAYSEIATRTRSKTNPNPARGRKDKQARRGFKRYQAWEDAQKRQQASHSAPSGQPSFGDQSNESQQAQRVANNVSGLYSRDERPPAEEPQRVQRSVAENLPRYREVPVSRPLEPVQYHQVPASRALESGHYVQREVMLRSSILDQYQDPPPRSTYEYVNRPLLVESGERYRSEAPRVREPRQGTGMTRPFSPHDVLPSIERGDLPSDRSDRRGSPVMMNARQVRNAPPRAYEEQVVYTRGEPEPKRFRPLPAHSNVIYVDEPEVVPKRRRVAVDPGVEYVRLHPVPHSDDRFFPSSSSAAPSQGMEARRYDAFPQSTVDSQPSIMPQQPMAPRELRPVRNMSDHNAAFGKLSLDDRVQRGESQAPMRQRVDPGPAQLRVMEQQPSTYVPETCAQGAYEVRYGAQEPQYYQRPVAVSREQAEYQSRAPAPVYAALPPRPVPAERPRSELPPRPVQAERPRSELPPRPVPAERPHSALPPRPLPAERPRSELPARLLPAERPYGDYESQPVEYRRVPSRDQQFREVRTRPQEELVAPRYATRPVRPEGGEVRYEGAPGPAPNGPKMYSRSTPRPGEVIVLD